MYMSEFMIFMTCVMMIILNFTMNKMEKNIYNWNFNFNSNINIDFTIMTDMYSTLFAMTILFISSNIMLFSKNYMYSEKENKQFIILMILFILSMIMLIFIPHLLFLLIGWDGLGLVSFLLVIYYPSNKSLSAGMITAITNRIGDILIITMLPIMLTTMIFTPTKLLNSNMIMLTSLLLLTATMTKSAQMPFSAWLPEAMEAPTPISALVHSSTLVTAGVFLLIRFYPTLNQFPNFKMILMLPAALTMLMAGMTACKETDMKKIIALSTLSQLGVMMFSISMGLTDLAFFHLISHATFKALLFISAGNIIMQNNHSQDTRQMGTLNAPMKLTLTVIVISSLSLIGFPFMAGYYSKDLIIESTMFLNSNMMSYLAMMFATLMTVMYSMKMLDWLIKSPKMMMPFCKITNYSKSMNTTLMLMSLFVIFNGPFMNTTILFPNTHPTLSTMMKLMVPMTLTMFISIKVFFYDNHKYMLKFNTNMFNTNMWFISMISKKLFTKKTLITGENIYKNVDAHILEMLIGKGLTNLSTKISLHMSKYHTNSMMTNFYALMFIILLMTQLF